MGQEPVRHTAREPIVSTSDRQTTGSLAGWWEPGERRECTVGATWSHAQRCVDHLPGIGLNLDLVAPVHGGHFTLDISMGANSYGQESSQLAFNKRQLHQCNIKWTTRNTVKLLIEAPGRPAFIIRTSNLDPWFVLLETRLLLKHPT